jgi:hypothetical protein
MARHVHRPWDFLLTDDDSIIDLVASRYQSIDAGATIRAAEIGVSINDATK